LHDALDDSLMAEDLMKADEERLLQYTLQLSIVEQEKMREAEERKAILEAQDLAYQEALLLDQEKERLQQEEELREQILKDEIEKSTKRIRITRNR